MTTTRASLLAEIRGRLAAAGFAEPALEARLLVSALLELTLTDLVVKPDVAVSAEDAEQLRAALSRRLAHEPVHRILGYRDFHGLRLALSPETLEPRPDTEVLVDAVLRHVKTAGVRPAGRLLDLGTGSGAIALALLNALPEFHGTGLDISAGALETASRNAHVLGMGDRFKALQSNWFDKVQGRFDIIVSNPPYIRSEVIGGLEPEVRDYDPLLALDGGADGLEAYRRIACDSRDFLEDNGLLALEIGYDQKQAVTKVFTAQDYTLIESVSDYGGNDRALLFRAE
ncbi:peptide chain release factor N(5)-glutamine methyltransferase [Rhizobium sp. SSA_523]|uniref:peptide chain release factor N(5)-glutamine methyltransferase n=1 Tax=Rhizobium sp. SSA_523 TaxID=2952477 RepID=UPI002091D338|nr:peptide chain release factor N(5)-glutamine methyltransferase [Rhizobium sp. SSA_523]MCO5733713.1 peptide chain release factor N(5)-glutamine methyltransferase [Rhizobium sp. SSA_523]WKC23000.1 peptide chain release factor N(5)-glutamine methyltransferase [Rhizobium sp. SSA_523]